VACQENLSHHRLELRFFEAACSHPHGNSGGCSLALRGPLRKRKKASAFSRALIREEEVEAGHSDPGVRYAPAPGVQAFRWFRGAFQAFVLACLVFVTSCYSMNKIENN